MKRQVHFRFPCLLVLLTVLTACEDRGDEHLFCDVTLMTSLPDGRSIVRMEADASLAGTFLRNVNNRQEYDFPLFVNNRGTVRVQKGVYLISFDARATFSDGTTARVRSSQHANPEKAVTLLNDTEAVVLQLTLLN